MQYVCCTIGCHAERSTWSSLMIVITKWILLFHNWLHQVNDDVVSLFWQAGCGKSIMNDKNVFARLDHFQEHELATRISQASARRNAMTTSTKHVPKRRGRPPKQAQNFSTIDFSSGSSGSRHATLKPKGQHPWVVFSPYWFAYETNGDGNVK